MGDQGADANNRVVDVLGKLVAHRLADFVIGFANKVISSGKAPKIGHGFEVPDDDMVGMVGAPQNRNGQMISSCH